MNRVFLYYAKFLCFIWFQKITYSELSTYNYLSKTNNTQSLNDMKKNEEECFQQLQT